MQGDIKFTLSYSGQDADDSVIDLYDVAQALVGFQRSLALTTHLVLNGEIITQSPSLKGAKILSFPAEEGSWKLTTIVLAAGAGLYSLGTAKNDSPIGHLVYSLYDYVLSESLGIHVEYNKPMAKLYEEAQKRKQPLPEIKQSQADSLLEKCHTAIREMHRPIYKTQTASKASISANVAGENLPMHTTLDMETFDFIHETMTSDSPEQLIGRITSYNSNTFKGRIFIAKFGRPVSFDLSPPARNPSTVRLITTSLRFTALKQFQERGTDIQVTAFKNTSRSGHLKTLTITSVSNAPYG